MGAADGEHVFTLYHPNGNAQAVSLAVPNRENRRARIVLDCGGRLAGDREQRDYDPLCRAR